MFQTFQIPVGGFDSNFSYLLVCGSDALIIDPCGDVSAIRRAVELARPDDILLVAGKGHENYQEINGVKHHMDDRELIREAIR